MKKIISFALIACMLLVICAPASAVESENIQKVETYHGQFIDVPVSSWFAEYVQTAYEYGLMSGISDTSFDPDGNLTVAAAIVIACRLHNLYYGNNFTFLAGEPWYQSYVDYAWENEIITNEYTYDAPVTRADFALFVSNALPDEALPKINVVWAGDIPDLASGSPFFDAYAVLADAGLISVNNAFQLFFMSIMFRDSLGLDNVYATSDSYNAIYRLYTAGILTGNDEYGTFTPDANMTRSSAATIISRTVEPSLRQHITLTQKPATLVPMNQLVNLSSLQKSASSSEFAQAYDIAKEVVEPLANLSTEAQLCGITMALNIIYSNEIMYSMSADHYNDPYGFFVLHTASCAGCTRAVGLCLNMLGIPYEHVNENLYTHQWARVNVNGTYWICDADGMYCGPEQAPYEYPNLS